MTNLPAASASESPLCRDAGIEVPVICGAMYPCSNPELVAAASGAGGIGIVQPLSLTHVHGMDFREGLRHIRSLTDRPIGMNALIEGSSRRYRARMEGWIEIALEEGIRFFVTSLGKPDWVVARVHREGAKVYHDVTERRWALKGVESRVDGLIAVNRNAGGHPGERDPRALLDEVHDLGLPVVCAGGISTPGGFVHALSMGYAGIQMGTRFIATLECTASDAYKAAILAAGADDVVWTERLTGIPVAVLRTPRIQAEGTRAGPLMRRLLRWRRTRHLARNWLAHRSARELGKGARSGYWQAGRSVEGVGEILPAGEIVRHCREALLAAPGAEPEVCG